MDRGSEPIRFELELEREAQPLAGQITNAQGLARRFVGWTGLAAALTVALEEAERDEPR